MVGADPDAWTLAPLVTAARIGAYCVFLDRRRDSYFCVPWASMASLVESGDAARGDRCVVALERSGLVSRCDQTRALDLVRHPTPRETVTAQWARPARLASLPALGACVWADRRLSRQSFSSVTAWAHESAGARPATLDEARRALRDFHGARAWHPRAYNCVFDCVAMLRFLRSRRLSATWVFGARLYPFAAHCWLEVEGVALGEDEAHLMAFTPLLVI